MDVDAAPVLLDLAKNAADEKYKIRALRGYIRLVRQFAMPDAERAEMCRAALETAQRDAEKKLVLEVIGRYPNAAMLTLALEAAKIPALKNEAAGGGADHRPEDSAASRPSSRRCWPRSARAGEDRDPQGRIRRGRQVQGRDRVLRKHVHDFPVIILPSARLQLEPSAATRPPAWSSN